MPSWGVSRGVSRGDAPPMREAYGAGDLIVAASNSPLDVRKHAHFTCRGNDDQAVINQAIQEWTKKGGAGPGQYGSTGGAVKLAPGKFRCSQPININQDRVNLFGSGWGFWDYGTGAGYPAPDIEGPGISLVEMTSDADGLQLTGTGPIVGAGGGTTDYRIRGIRVAFIYFYGYGLTGTGVNVLSSAGFIDQLIFEYLFVHNFNNGYTPTADTGLMFKCTVMDSAGIGINATAGNGLDISHCQISDIGGAAIYYKSDNFVGIGLIHHNTIGRCGGAQVGGAGPAGAICVDSGSFDTQVHHNIIGNPTAGGIITGSYRTNIAHNQVRNAPSFGIIASAADVTVMGNQLVGCGGVEIGMNGDRPVVIGNNIVSTQNVDGHINIDNCNQGTLAGNVITGSGTAFSLIRIGQAIGAAKGVAISGNTVQQITNNNLNPPIGYGAGSTAIEGVNEFLGEFGGTTGYATANSPDAGTPNWIEYGCVWAPINPGVAATASMTAGYVWINGRRLAVAGVGSRAFTNGQDTYVDFTDNGDGTALINYTTVPNNTASPAMPATTALAVRNAIVVCASGHIAANGVNQGDPRAAVPVVSSQIYSVCDGLGHLIYPCKKQPILIGYRQITAPFSSTTVGAFVTVTGLGPFTVEIPAPSFAAATNKLSYVRIRVVPFSLFQTGAAGVTVTVAILDNDTSAFIGQALYSNPVNAAADSEQVVAEAVVQKSAGTHTFTIQMFQNAAGTMEMNAGATFPSIVTVELL